MDGREVRGLSWGDTEASMAELGAAWAWGAGGQCRLASPNLGHLLGLHVGEPVTEDSDKLLGKVRNMGVNWGLRSWGHGQLGGEAEPGGL